MPVVYLFVYCNKKDTAKLLNMNIYDSVVYDESCVIVIFHRFV